MTIGILAAGLGLLLAAAAIVIPRLVNRRNDPEYDADSRAYQKETGRSARDIAQDNADQAFQQEKDSGSHQVGGSDGPARPSLSRGLALVRNTVTRCAPFSVTQERNAVTSCSPTPRLRWAGYT